MTDGILQSAPTTVTIHVVPQSQNSAPVWCGIDNCTQTWPTASLTPGGTVSVPVTEDWVDPDGDPFVLSDAHAVMPNAPIQVVATSDGNVVIHHTDPNGAAGSYAIQVTITDDNGATATKTMLVQVSSESALATTPATMLTGIGQHTTFTLAPYVQGGSGTYRLVDAVVTGDKNQASAIAGTATNTIQFTGNAAGQYTVVYTVQDIRTDLEQTGIVRFNVVAVGGQLTAPPLTAFVLPQQDTTLSILSSVTNTTGNVLALTSAASDTAGLSVSVIDNSELRVSGTTPNGEPGKVGDVTATITDAAGHECQTLVTVFLVNPDYNTAPLARPDAITVHTGTQVDIPVLDNDVAPRGESLALSPRVEGSTAPGELAFASNGVLRYLAPSKAGVYTLRYSAYVVTNPALTSSSTVTVTVLGGLTNHAPQPQQLVARVRAGDSVTVTVPSIGQDPDGESTVVTAVSEPKSGSGTASIGSAGSTIIYHAPDNGVPGGQVTFNYTLTDPSGASGQGAVQIAVVNADNSNPAPVAYTDSVRTIVNSDVPLTVQPLQQDSDPAGGDLRLLSVVPNAPAGSAEYARLQSLINPSTDLSAGYVVLSSGAVQGVQSYIYTVQSSATSSTAQGLIVVTVTDEVSEETPEVTDTTITAADRDSLSTTGIDVVTGKVTWQSGNVTTLAVSVWGSSAESYSVIGQNIVGPAPVGGAIVPFAVTGVDETGRPVVGYGFLRIPAFNNIRLQTVPTLNPFQVGELQSTTVSLKNAVAIGAGDALQVEQSTSFDVQRPNASCTSSGGLNITYNAGIGAPWTDMCTVLVRLVGQSDWTQLPIAFAIQPKTPQPELNSVSRTIAPGAAITIGLYTDMTVWQGGKVGDIGALRYNLSSSSSDFILNQSGNSVQISALANAQPGTQADVIVSVASFGGLTAVIALTVGISPPDTPRGATFTQTCSVDSGSSCTATVVGVSGQYDPFAGKPGAGLKVVSLNQSLCPVAALTLAGTTGITATWPTTSKPPGGTCTVAYTVADAQGRLGQGVVTFDIEGYPAQPSSLQTIAYTGSSVTLLVTLGQAVQAHPSLTGVAIFEGDQQVPNSSCAPDVTGTYSCTVSGLQNGQQHAFTARALNSLGQSLSTSPDVTWAYQPPVLNSVEASSPYDPDQTTQSTGVLTLSLSASNDTNAYRILVDDSEVALVVRTRSTQIWTGTVSPGSHLVSVIPISGFQPPIGTLQNSGAEWSQSVSVAGAPIVSASGAVVVPSNTELDLTNVSFDWNSAPVGTILYAAWLDGTTAPTCSMDTHGNPVFAGGQSSELIKGLQEYKLYDIQACGSNGYGAVSTQVLSAYTFATGPAADPVTYSIDPTPTATTTGGNVTAETIDQNQLVPPTIPQIPSFAVVYRIDGSDTTVFSLPSDAETAAISYRYCFRGNLSECGDNAPITAASNSIPTFVSASVPSACLVSAPDASDVTVSGPLTSPADYRVDVTTDTTNLVAKYAIAFTGAYAPLGTWTLTRCITPNSSSTGGSSDSSGGSESGNSP